MTDVFNFNDQEWEMPAASRDYPPAPVILRPDFLDEFADDYKDGQHVTLIGPTQRGKSRLGKEMLKRVISPSRKALVLVGKPPGRERTWDDAAAEELDLRVIDRYPPGVPDWASIRDMMKHGRDKNRNGFLLRPRQAMQEVEEDNAELRRQFKAGIMGQYRKASGTNKLITVVDEGHQTQVDLKLKNECEAPLMRGAPDNAEWTFMQRSRFVSYLCYDAPEHVLIFRDDDRSNQQRLSEIGGVDSRYLAHLVSHLRTERVPSGGTISQAVYFRRASNDVRIVDT